jgi:hypothetical protein
MFNGGVIKHLCGDGDKRVMGIMLVGGNINTSLPT